MHKPHSDASLVIFGSSNIISDIVDAALSHGIKTRAIVMHDPETPGPRDLALAERVKQFSPYMTTPAILEMAEFQPMSGDIYLLGPTTPMRQRLVTDIAKNWTLEYCTLVHKTAYVSPMVRLSQGVFVGANSVIAPGAKLSEHVFINRGVTVGHDTQIGAFSRIQPGASLGGLSVYGEGVTVGLGATVLERLVVGSQSVVAAGSVVLSDVPEATMVAGIPAVVKKSLAISKDLP